LSGRAASQTQSNTELRLIPRNFDPLSRLCNEDFLFPLCTTSEVSIFSRCFIGSDKSYFFCAPLQNRSKRLQLSSVTPNIKVLTAALFVHQIFARSVAAQLGGSAVDKWRPSLGNQTALHKNTAPAWVSEPQYRGTASILYSCIVTLILCVYSALHPNVPAYGESRLAIYRRSSGL